MSFQVKHSADELDAGETMILTLEDKSILDEKGNLVEEDDADALINTAVAQEKKVAKAKRAAMKRGIHYGEVIRTNTAPIYSRPFSDPGRPLHGLFYSSFPRSLSLFTTLAPLCPTGSSLLGFLFL